MKIIVRTWAASSVINGYLGYSNLVSPSNIWNFEFEVIFLKIETPFRALVD